MNLKIALVLACCRASTAQTSSFDELNATVPVVKTEIIDTYQLDSSLEPIRLVSLLSSSFLQYLTEIFIHTLFPSFHCPAMPRKATSNSTSSPRLDGFSKKAAR
jgi:hypothetical protein